MNADLLYSAAKLVPNYQILVNVVRLRVLQLCGGHRPLAVCAPGLGAADIALTEIIQGKLTFELLGDAGAANGLPAMLPFPTSVASKKAA